MSRKDANPQRKGILGHGIRDIIPTIPGKTWVGIGPALSAPGANPQRRGISGCGIRDINPTIPGKTWVGTGPALSAPSAKPQRRGISGCGIRDINPTIPSKTWVGTGPALSAPGPVHPVTREWRHTHCGNIWVFHPTNCGGVRGSPKTLTVSTVVYNTDGNFRCPRLKKHHPIT